MKTNIFLTISLFLTLTIQAQVSKTVNVAAGGLTTTLTAQEKSTVTNLTVTGTVDARDFKTMRDEMPLLAVIDISGVTITAHKGEGTYPYSTSFSYSSNEIPIYAFGASNPVNGKKSLVQIIIPNSVTAIGEGSFSGCSNLTTINISSSINKIGDSAFRECTGLTGIFTIPLGVTSINNSTFSGCKSLTSIVIPAGVLSIGQYSFWNCTSWSGNVVLPTSLQNITQGAFNSCTSLSAITIPTTTTNIDPDAFQNCSASITINASNPNYSSDNGLFFDKNKTTLFLCPTSKTGSYTIPTTVTLIQSYAFQGCGSLASVNIPAATTTIGESAFYKCSANLVVGSGNPNYASEDGVLFNKQKTTLIQCPLSKAGSYSIPSGVESVGMYAFRDCNSLNSLTFPNTIISVGTYAFWKCTGLTGALNLPSSLKTIGGGSFQDCSGITSIILPTTITSIASNAFDGCSGLKLVEIPSSVTAISSSTFWNCTGLETVVIPSSVTTIGRGAFFGCKALKSITVNCVAPIDLSAVTVVFDSVNTNSCKLYVPYGTTDLYANADKWSDFKNVIEVEGLFATPSIIKLGATAGEKTKISIASSNSWNATSNQSWLSLTPAIGIAGRSEIGIAALSANGSGVLRSATLTVSSAGNACQTISVSQFCNVEVYVNAGGLKTALEGRLDVISDLSITGKIDARDFKTMRDNMPELVVLDLSGATIVAYSGADGTKDPFWGVVNYLADVVPASAFYISSGKKLTTVLLPVSTKMIDESAFRSCSFLRNFVLPEQLITIGFSAFSNCSSLKAIDIPSLVTAIGNSAFSSCSKLSSVTIPTSVITIGNQSFNNCISLTSIVIPPSVTLIDGSAFKGCRSLTTVTIPSSVNEIGWNAFDGCSNLSEAIFGGNAPTKFRTDVFKNTNKRFKILYYPAETGFTTPFWNGYPCYPINDPPIVNAGSDQTVIEGALVTLDGSATSDVNGDSLTYKWIATGNIVLEDDTLLTTSFKAPQTKTDNQFVFCLEINDHWGNVVRDSVTITVKHLTRNTVVMNFSQPAELKLNISQNTFDILPDSLLDLHQNIEVEGGRVPYSFHWYTSMWQGDSVTNYLSVSPVDTTIYHLLVYDDNGCSASDNFAVNVIHPLQVIAEKNDAGCFGARNGSIKLTVSQGKSPYTYAWSNDETTSEINGLAAGRYQVKVSDNMGQTYSQEFEIFELQEYNTSVDASICEGEGYYIGNNSYSLSGQYSETLTSIHGCDSIIELSLTVNPLNSSTTEASICNGESYLFRDKLYNQSGLYSDTLISSLGCDSLFNLQLTVNPLPEKPIITVNGDLLTSSATLNQWFENGVGIFDAIDQQYSINKSGNFHVVAYNEKGCSAISDTVSLICSDTHQIDKINFDCLVYPNPNNGLFKLKLRSKENLDLTVSLFSVYGKIILSKSINSAQNNIEIPMFFSQLPKGIYMLKVSSGRNIVNKKIVIQ